MKQKILNFLLLLTTVTTISTAIPSCKSGTSDADIQKAVSEKLQTMPETANITASVKDGVVTLSGECKDQPSKDMCESTAKSVTGVKSVVNNCTVASTSSQTAPVEISGDDALTQGVNDAVKDYNGVKATVNDGVVTLTGEIKRSDLQKLMMSLNTLKPKKIDNQLVIK